MWVDTKRWAPRVLPSWWFESLYRAFFGVSGFLWTNSLALPGSEPTFGSCEGPPCVGEHHLAKQDSTEEVYGQVGFTYYGAAPHLFLTSKETFFTCVVREVSLTLSIRNILSFITYLGSA